MACNVITRLLCQIFCRISCVHRHVSNQLILIFSVVPTLLECSTILDGNIGHAKQLVEWVEDRTLSWKLCYRGSVDGWKADDFHKKCDDVGPTVTLIKCGKKCLVVILTRAGKHIRYSQQHTPLFNKNGALTHIRDLSPYFEL